MYYLLKKLTKSTNFNMKMRFFTPEAAGFFRKKGFHRSESKGCIGFFWCLFNRYPFR